jgi:hypothetical protein
MKCEKAQEKDLVYSIKIFHERPTYSPSLVATPTSKTDRNSEIAGDGIKK